MQLQLLTQRVRQVEVIHVSGSVDSNNFINLANVLHTQLKDCKKNGAIPQLILDCHAVSYIGSAEIRQLGNFTQLARALRGDIKCARIAPTIEQIITLVANGDPIECYPDIANALSAFSNSRIAA